MPRFTVEKSLFDPIEVDINGKVYTALPFSNRLIRQVNDLAAKIKSGEVDGMAGTVQMASLIFGAPLEEFDQLDVRALNPAIEFVTAQMTPKKKPADAQVAVAETTPPADPGDGKNG